MPTVRRICVILLMNLVGLAAGARTAAADEIVCGLVEGDVIVVDGMLDDWQGVKGVRWGAAKDAGMSVRCNYDASTLWIAIDVTDDLIIRRGKKDKGAEDAVVFAFGAGKRLEVSPADSEGTIPLRARWAGGAAAKGLEVQGSLQPRGWSIELAMPKAKVPGLGERGTRVAVTIDFVDADMFSEKAAQETVSTGPGALVLEEGDAVYRQVLEDLRIKPKDIWLDEVREMNGDAGSERVIAAGRTVVVIGESYSYMQLPVQKRADVKALKLANLGGEGKHAIVAHYVERGGGGSREVVGVWMVGGDGSFSRPLAVEVAKESPAGRMENTWALEPKKETVPAKKKGGKPKIVTGKGLDLVVRVGSVRGFTAETWNETPAEDMAPILLPWGEQKEQRWHFRGDEAYGDAAE